jgi:hypothetical protein
MFPTIRAVGMSADGERLLRFQAIVSIGRVCRQTCDFASNTGA